MDPITIGLGVVGLGLSLFGGLGQAQASKEAANISKGIAGDEQRINAQKQQQMMLESGRNQLEIYRNMQRARARATQAAVSQGAQLGSGLQGGLAQVTDQSFFNFQGINQNVELGQNIFGINNDISNKKMQLADVQGKAATDAGLASLGGALIKAGPMIGAMGKGFGGLSFGGGGNYTGTPGASNTGGLY